MHSEPLRISGSHARFTQFVIMIRHTNPSSFVRRMLMKREKSIPEYPRRTTWFRRGVYFLLIIAVVILTPFILDIVGTLVAGGDWKSFAETLFGEPTAAQAFLASFAVTLIIVGVILYLALSMFETTEGGW